MQFFPSGNVARDKRTRIISQCLFRSDRQIWEMSNIHSAQVRTAYSRFFPDPLIIRGMVECMQQIAAQFFLHIALHLGGGPLLAFLKARYVLFKTPAEPFVPPGDAVKRDAEVLEPNRQKR